MLVIGGRADWSCMQAGIGLEGCCRTIAACGHRTTALRTMPWNRVVRGNADVSNQSSFVGLLSCFLGIVAIITIFGMTLVQSL